MAEVEPKDLLLFSFRYLKYGFLHPIHHENSTVARLIVYTVLALACSDFFIILHQTIFYPNIRMFLSNTEWAVAASSAVVKLTVCRGYRKRLLSFIHHSDRLWDLSIINDEKLKSSIRSTLKTTTQFQKIFVRSYVVTAIASVLTPVIRGNKQLMTGELNKDAGYMLWVYSLCSQEVFVMHAITYFAAIDALMVGACMTAVVQLRMIGYAYRNLQFNSKEAFLSSLRNTVEHHSFILSFVSLVQTTFSPIITVAYFCCLFGIIAEVYILLDSDLTLATVVLIIRCVYLLYVVGMYCLAAQLVSAEAVLVAREVYNSGWYGNSNPMTKKSMTIVTSVTQTPLTIKAAGMFDVNLRTFLKVIQLIWTYVNMLLVLKRKT